MPTGSTECVPAMPEPLITRLDIEVADRAYYLNLLEQGSVEETIVSVDAIMRQLAEQRRATKERRRANGKLE